MDTIAWSLLILVVWILLLSGLNALFKPRRDNTLTFWIAGTKLALASAVPTLALLD